MSAESTDRGKLMTDVYLTPVAELPPDERARAMDAQADRDAWIARMEGSRKTPLSLRGGGLIAVLRERDTKP